MVTPGRLAAGASSPPVVMIRQDQGNGEPADWAVAARVASSVSMARMRAMIGTRAVESGGDHCIKLGLQGAPFRRDGVLGVQERDGALEVAAVVAKLEGCERVQWVLGLVYCQVCCEATVADSGGRSLRGVAG